MDRTQMIAELRAEAKDLAEQATELNRTADILAGIKGAASGPRSATPISEAASGPKKKRGRPPAAPKTNEAASGPATTAKAGPQEGKKKRGRPPGSKKAQLASAAELETAGQIPIAVPEFPGDKEFNEAYPDPPAEA